MRPHRRETPPRGARTHPLTRPAAPARERPRARPPARPLQSYKDDNVWRETSVEKREAERLQWDYVNDVRRAAEVRGREGGGRGSGKGGVRRSGCGGSTSTACAARQR